MTTDAVVKLLAALVAALPSLAAPLLSMLRDEHADAVRAQLAGSHARLDAMTSPRDDVEAVLSRHRVAPTTAPVIERLLSSHVATQTLTGDEVRELRAAVGVVRAVEAGHLVSAVPPVLDPPPPNPFGAPDQPED